MFEPREIILGLPIQRHLHHDIDQRAVIAPARDDRIAANDALRFQLPERFSYGNVAHAQRGRYFILP